MVRGFDRGEFLILVADRALDAGLVDEGEDLDLEGRELRSPVVDGRAVLGRGDLGAGLGLGSGACAH